MLHITNQAADHLQHVRGKKGLDESSIARFIRRDGRVKLTFTKAPERGDVVVGLDGIKVALAPDLAETFGDSTVDARTKDGKTWLVMEPPRTVGARRAGGTTPG